jgi:hypothetical protein
MTVQTKPSCQQRSAEGAPPELAAVGLVAVALLAGPEHAGGTGAAALVAGAEGAVEGDLVEPVPAKVAEDGGPARP